MLGTLAGFVKDKAAGLVSKKVAATAVGVGVVGAQDPQLGGWILVAYIAVQGLVDVATLYINRRYPDE